MPCTKCDSESLKGRSLCQEHWNEYMRGFRERSVLKREKAALARGYDAGILACRNLLRQMLGDRTVSGHQAAQIIERHISGVESAASAQQRAFLQQLSGR
jgi:hypothetical protein